jgi:hypothetical protein
MPVSDSRILLIATFGMEIVECGGALVKNVQAGGKSYAAVVLAREESKPNIQAACRVLGVDVQFLDFTYGDVTVDAASKRTLVRVIRQIKPDIVICQDPEHSFDDLDPDRRQAMILYLESIALASRDFALEDMPGLHPHPIPALYFMTPSRPNCVVNVADVWELKEKAMAQLKSQMAFSGQVLRQKLGDKGVRALVGLSTTWKDDAELGTLLHREMDRAFHLYHGLLTHGNYALAEPYRRLGNFHFERLVP